MAKAKNKTRYNLGPGAIYQRQRKRGFSWNLDFQGREKRIQKVIPHATTKEEAAIAFWDAVREEFDKEHDVRREKADITFKEFAEFYMEGYARTAKKSYKTDEFRLRNMIPYFDEHPMRKISPMIIQQYRSQRLEKGISPRTANREIALLKKMFNIAIEEEYLEKNPVNKVKMFSELENIRDRVLKPKEEKKLFAELAEHAKPVVLTALHTGLRLNEVLSLSWGDIDLENHSIKVTHTKSKKARYVPINSVLFPALEKLRIDSQSDSVFPFKSIRTAFDNACQRAGIKNFTFHDLRRTFGTRLLEGGVDIVTISRLYGHSSVLVTQRYLHPKDELSKEAVELLAEKTREYCENEGILLPICDEKDIQEKAALVTTMNSVN